MQVSNLRPPACKAGALPAELITHNLFSRNIFVLRLNYMKNPRSCKVENCTNVDLTYLVTRTGIEPMIPP